MCKYFAFIFILFLFGCRHSSKQNAPASGKDSIQVLLPAGDSLPKTQIPSIAELELRRKELEEAEKMDSLRLQKVLRTALNFAEANKHKSSFRHDYETFPDDSSFIVHVNLYFDTLFDLSERHLLVVREIPGATILNIFLFQHEKFMPVMETVQSGMTYIDHSIKDVNGDHRRDFLVHWYPMAGCCLADLYHVWLYNQKTGKFSVNHEFINPTFFPEEGIIRGLDYGQPGEAGLYKFKWKGLRIDTIEFIYQSRLREGRYIKTARPDYRPGPDGNIELYALPKEYLKIDSNALAWFMTRF